VIDRTPLASCGRSITRHPLLACKDIENFDHLNLLEVSAIVTMPEDEGKRRSKKERSSRPCLPDNFDALLECRDLTVDLMIEKMQTLLPVPTTYWHVCKHRLALTGQGGPLDLRAQQCRPLLACYLSRGKTHLLDIHP